MNPKDKRIALERANLLDEIAKVLEESKTPDPYLLMGITVSMVIRQVSANMRADVIAKKEAT
jgi:hypothetical protein